MSEAHLRASCEHLGLPASDESIRNLLILKAFFDFYGRSMNLTGKPEAIESHIVEGLQVAALARRVGVVGPWLDVGSGGGFPGLVLAAMLDVELTLVEPRAKRAASLELALAKLGRRDVKVLRGRVEQGRWKSVGGDQLEGEFDAASARAVFAPTTWVEEAGHWVRPGGLICLHLGAGEPPPPGCELVARVDGPRWSAVGVRAVPRGTPTR